MVFSLFGWPSSGHAPDSQSVWFDEDSKREVGRCSYVSENEKTECEGVRAKRVTVGVGGAAQGLIVQTGPVEFRVGGSAPGSHTGIGCWLSGVG